jgi:hypothetical protein
MSLFGNLQSANIKGPDVVINGDGGSLLPTSSAGMRFSSAEINQQSQLLSDVKPYRYGQGSVSDDIAQQVTPHKIQKIVPSFKLPSTSTSLQMDDILMVHSVSDGDLAFTIRMEGNTSRVQGYNSYSKQNLTRAVDILINLPTLNYILRGLQTNMGKNHKNWENFLYGTGWPNKSGTHLTDFHSGPDQYRNLALFVQDYVRPIGVVIGSDNQGGQHQGDSRGAVDNPVDYVVTILVDGLCDNLVNLWKRAEVKAGDDLMLVLAGTELKAPSGSKVAPAGCLGNQFDRGDPKSFGGLNLKNFAPPTQHVQYVLNHYSKAKRQGTFEQHCHTLYEMVPTSSTEIHEGHFLGSSARNHGLWHIARSQVQARVQPAFGQGAQTFRNDNANMTGGALLQATIAPVWKGASRCGRRDTRHLGPSGGAPGTVASATTKLTRAGRAPYRAHGHGSAVPASGIAPVVVVGPGGGGGAAAAITGLGVRASTEDEPTEADTRTVKRRAGADTVDIWDSNSGASAGPQVVQRAAAAAVEAAAPNAPAPDTQPIATDGTPKVYAQSISMTSGVSQSRAVPVAKVTAKKK